MINRIVIYTEGTCEIAVIFQLTESASLGAQSRITAENVVPQIIISSGIKFSCPHCTSWQLFLMMDLNPPVFSPPLVMTTPYKWGSQRCTVLVSVETFFVWVRTSVVWKIVLQVNRNQYLSFSLPKVTYIIPKEIITSIL